MVPPRPACEHVPENQAPPRGEACQDCGSRMSLRMCATCGRVGCCESQASHARSHALAEDHPVIRQLPLSGRSFTWCYRCRAYV